MTPAKTAYITPEADVIDPVTAMLASAMLAAALNRRGPQGAVVHASPASPAKPAPAARALVLA